MPINYADLTPRQRDALRAVIDHLNCHGEPPTIVEVSETLGLSNRMGGYAVLNALEAKGYVRRVPGAPRGLIVLKDLDGEAIVGRDEAA